MVEVLTRDELHDRARASRDDVFVRDRSRQNALLGAEWLVLRYTAEDLRWRPDAVVAEIAHTLLRATAAPIMGLAHSL